MSVAQLVEAQIKWMLLMLHASEIKETARVSAVEATHLFASKRLLLMRQQQNTKSHGIRRYRQDGIDCTEKVRQSARQVQADTPKNAIDTIPKQTLTMLETI